MYEEHGVLEDFRRQLFQQLPDTLASELRDIPKKGTMDLKQVNASEFFFS